MTSKARLLFAIALVACSAEPERPAVVPGTHSARPTVPVPSVQRARPTCPREIGAHAALTLDPEAYGVPPPGAIVRDVSTIRFGLHRDATEPARLGEEEFEVNGRPLRLAYLNWPGNAAGIILLRRVDELSCVIDSWFDAFGGNGVELSLQEYFRSPDGSLIVFLLSHVGRLRGGASEDAQSTFQQWTVLASDGEALWDLADFDLSENVYRAVRLDGGRLVAERKSGTSDVFVLDATKDSFVSATAVPAIARRASIPATSPPRAVARRVSVPAMSPPRAPLATPATQRPAQRARFLEVARGAAPFTLFSAGSRVLAYAASTPSPLLDVSGVEGRRATHLMRGLPDKLVIGRLMGPWPNYAFMEATTQRGLKRTYRWQNDHWSEVQTGPLLLRGNPWRGGRVLTLRLQPGYATRSNRYRGNYEFIAVNDPLGVVPIPTPRPAGVRTPCATAMIPEFFESLPSGDLFALGKDCNQGVGREAPFLVDHWPPGAERAALGKLPSRIARREPRVDSVIAAPPSEVYVAGTLADRAYVARYDGSVWTSIDTPPDAARATSVAVTEDGAVWLAAERLWRREADGTWQAVSLELGSDSPLACRVDQVLAQGGHVWAAGWCDADREASERSFIVRSMPHPVREAPPDSSHDRE